VEASNDYDVLLFVVGVDNTDPLNPVATCTSTDVGHLKTNLQGKGVLNFKFNATAPSVQAALVLRDAQAPLGVDLGTDLLTFTKP
jgi:hypothetical protein